MQTPGLSRKVLSSTIHGRTRDTGTPRYACKSPVIPGPYIQLVFGCCLLFLAGVTLVEHSVPSGISTAARVVGACHPRPRLQLPLFSGRGAFFPPVAPLLAFRAQRGINLSSGCNPARVCGENSVSFEVKVLLLFGRDSGPFGRCTWNARTLCHPQQRKISDGTSCCPATRFLCERQGKASDFEGAQEQNEGRRQFPSGCYNCRRCYQTACCVCLGELISPRGHSINKKVPTNSVREGASHGHTHKPSPPLLARRRFVHFDDRWENCHKEWGHDRKAANGALNRGMAGRCRNKGFIAKAAVQLAHPWGHRGAERPLLASPARARVTDVLERVG